MNNKKQLSRKALLAISALGTSLVIASCGDEAKLEEKPIKIGSYSLVDSKNFDYLAGTGALTVSRDGKNVYVTAGNGRGLFHNDGSDLQKGWTKVAVETEFDETVGKAKIKTNKRIFRLSSANDGVLASVEGLRPALVAAPGNSLDNGVIYVKGNKADAAWTTRTLDVDSVAGAQPDKFLDSTPITGLVVTKDNSDVPYFFGSNSATPVEAIAKTKAGLKAEIVSNTVKRTGTAFNNTPHLISGGDHLFAVTNLGVTTMPKADIGTTKDFLNVAAVDGAAGSGVVGSNAFQMNAGNANDQVTSVMISGTNLFIGLGVAGVNDYQGGVAVYEIKANGTTPIVHAPDMAWRNISVIKLVVDAKGTVWAVTSNDVIEAKADGKKGKSYFDQPIFDAAVETFDSAKDGFKRETLPRENLNGAVFVKDKLVLSTSKGLLVPTEKEKKVRSGKVATTN